MTLLGSLRQLHEIDQEWDDKFVLYRSVRGRLSDQSELEAKRQAQQALQERLSATQSKMRDIELELASVQTKSKEVEDSLYSGRITTPRELENLRRDNQYLKRHIGQLEDDLLALMTEGDDLDEALVRGQAELGDLEARWATEHEVLIGQYKELRARLEQLKTQRERTRADLGASELTLYDGLRDRKGGVALAPMRDNTCQTCRVTVPSYKADLVRRAESAVTCEGCGRILYEA